MLLRRECRNVKTASSDDTSNAAAGLGLSPAQDKRRGLFIAFSARYQISLQLEHQPIETTLNILIKRHAIKPAEFVPLAKVLNLCDGRDTISEPLKLGKHIQIDIGGATKKRFSDFGSSPEAFLRAVRILLLGYALVSAADPTPRCSLDAAQRYISCVEAVSRLSAKSHHANHQKILDADMSARIEWTRVAQAEPSLNLGDIIEIAANKHTIWPIAADLKGTKGDGSTVET